MDGCVDGCVDGWMDGCVEGWVDVWMDECVDGWMDGQMEREKWMRGDTRTYIVDWFNTTTLTCVFMCGLNAHKLI